MDSKYRFGKIDVSCEGYDHPDDPYVLRGSCGVRREREREREQGEREREGGRGRGERERGEDIIPYCSIPLVEV